MPQLTGGPYQVPNFRILGGEYLQNFSWNASIIIHCISIHLDFLLRSVIDLHFLL